MLHNMRIGPLACWLLALLAAGHAGDARSAATLPAVGENVESAVDLAGKQVVLPDGSWTVAGHGFDQVPGLDDVAYGAIENVVLFRIVDSRVAAFVLAQHNVIATERGWGFAPECRRSDLLHSIVWDGADGHSFCGIVAQVVTGSDQQPAAAWKSATAFAADRGLAMPASWLMAGFRRNNLTDTLDVRYHFDPALAGNPAVVGDVDWSRARIYGSASESLVESAMFWRTKPDREPPASPAVRALAEIVNDLRAWQAHMRYAIELGFENRAAELPVVPMPWTAADQTFHPELTVRLAGLGQLQAANVLPPVEYARQRAIAEELSAPTAGHRWTAEQLTVVKAVTDQVSGAISYFASDLLYTGSIQNASQIWALDQFLDAIRYSALEYGWQRLGPRRLATDQPVSLLEAGQVR